MFTKALYALKSQISRMSHSFSPCYLALFTKEFATRNEVDFDYEVKARNYERAPLSCFMMNEEGDFKNVDVVTFCELGIERTDNVRGAAIVNARTGLCHVIGVVHTNVIPLLPPVITVVYNPGALTIATELR